jgi:ABC-2 type transport system permease protein
MPMGLLFLCGYSISFDMKDLPLAVFDMDRSQESRNYINTIENNSFFHIKYYPVGYEQTKTLLDKGKTRCAIIIPSGFSRNIKEYRPAKLQILVDGTENITAIIIVNHLSAINASYSVDMTTRLFKKRGFAVDLEPVKLSTRIWYNQSLRDFTFIITGMFSLSIMAFVPILSALAIVREKESGSIQQIFASPVQSYEYIAGKMIPYVIFLFLDFIFVTIFGLWWFGIPIRGSFFILSVATFLMVFACVAIGFFISTLTRSQLTAMLLGIIFTLMPAIIFGDTIAPLQNSPEGWRLYSCLFPARFYTQICRAQILKGTGILSYWEDALSLVGYCIAIFSICAWRVKGKKI